MASKKIKKEIEKQVEEIILPEKYIEVAEKDPKIIELYKKMKYEYGEAVGVIAAQSISEPATQITLRSYHAAGRVQLVTTKGLPRLIEIFDAKKEPKTASMTIYLEDRYNNEKKAQEIASKIKETQLKDLMEEDMINLADMSIEIKIDTNKLNKYDLTLDKLISTISKTSTTLIIEGKENSIKVSSKNENITIKDLQNIRMKLRNKHVKGVKGIKQILIEQDKNGDWVIKTLGSNLKKILEIKGIDKRRTYTNNLFEVAEILGIEAARNLIIKEALDTMREQGVDTDVRHVMLVADMMTFTGEIKAIGRYGVAGNKSSVLARANFEETVKHLTKAAFRKEVDTLNSIVENVIIGNPVPVGTGMVRLRYKG